MAAWTPNAAHGMGLLAMTGGGDPNPEGANRFDGRGELRRSMRQENAPGNTGFYQPPRVIPAYQGYNVPWLQQRVQMSQNMAQTNPGAANAQPGMQAFWQQMLDRVQPGGALYNNPNRVGSTQEQFTAAQAAAQGQYADRNAGYVQQFANNPYIPTEAVQRLAAALSGKVGSTGR